MQDTSESLLADLEMETHRLKKATAAGRNPPVSVMARSAFKVENLRARLTRLGGAVGASTRPASKDTTARLPT